MTTLAESLADVRRTRLWDGPVVDCDVHAQFDGMAALWPYLEPLWQDFITERGYSGPPSLTTVYPAGAPSSVRPEWRADGVRAASTLEMMRTQALDAWNVERAVVSCYAGVDSCRHPDLAAALARAVNDWLISEWLDRDDRLRASMVVPIHTVADAAREIDRVGGHPGFVQVLMPVRAPQLYGRRNWYPLMEAITRQDLVFGLHFGGTGDGPPSPCGWPSWYIEEYAAEQQVFMSQVVSMVVEGTFQQFPSLRVAVLEGGFTWLPSLMWRFDKEWKGLRRTTPWLDAPPSELIARHMRFSTAPLDAGSPTQLARLLEWTGPEILMFASDYPHHHADDPVALLEALPEDARAGVMAGNARAFYRLG
ncbi:amidohydrolase family protein [Pseudonocardia sp. KRD291]|uniref:amidohydrolase family protein n=1 Tax=Pseudonocardia sp. KRD291 TaxID=2792007 RepID=UPI001C4A3D35|nr:amidohydrolase family protein [Pseudonocardia sp. KRD291]MBW0101030.1 amidohydrolase [Pseudonocardia sp. KRD291]